MCLGGPALPHLFFVEGAPGGGERSKPRSTGRIGAKPMGSTRRWALKCSTCAGAFHGSYTLSLTSTSRPLPPGSEIPTGHASMRRTYGPAWIDPLWPR